VRKCLIVIDYQNDFVSGSLGFPEAAALERGIADKIKQYRKSGGEVIFTFDTHGANYLDTQEGRKLPVAHCLEGTEGHKLFGEPAKLALESDMKFCKDTFGSDELYTYLKQEPFDSIELVGVVSNICVIANAILAKTAQPETPVIVDAKCTASNDGNLHQAVLAVMSGLQIEVIR
jgi:nicotinamidase-related amidase